MISLYSLFLRIAPMALALLVAARSPAADESLNTQTYWFGNTWSFAGGGGGSGKWMQQSLDDFALCGDKIYAITGWDEHSGEAGIYTTAGEKIGVPEAKGDFSIQFHSWGFHGGPAVAVDAQYVYYSMGQDGQAGQGKYAGVSRYDHAGGAAGWPGAKNTNRLVISDKHDAPPTGLAVCDGELFVSDPSAGRIRVFKTADLSLSRDIPFKNPGRIAIDTDSNHALWVVDSHSAVVRKIDRTGKDLGVKIADCKSPVALCIDRGDLLVADGGLDRQQIRRYKTANTTHVQGADFGSPVYAGSAPGAVAPGKFYRITSIQTDPSGNLYVGCWDYGAKLYKFDAARKLQWVLKGLEFVSCADADPGDDTSVYSPGHRYVIDYGKKPGESWTEAAVTLNPSAYPNDPRIREPWMAMRVFRFGGKKIMMGKPQMGAEMFFWRFDGEIAVPAAAYYPGGSNDPNYPPGHPQGPFFWCDTNGDGQMQPEEYSAAPAGSQASMIDIQGNLWTNTLGWEPKHGKIAKVPFAGVDKLGVPRWDTAHVTATPIPSDTGIQYLSKLSYDAVNDRMYLGVWTKEHPFPGGGWEQMTVGVVMQRFDNWSKQPKLAWQSDILPKDGLLGNSPKAWSLEEDYAFIAYTRKSEELAVDVIRLKDGQFLGRFVPTADIGSVTGWIDMNDAVQSHKRADGAYAVFVEEVWMAKGLYFLWKPAATRGAGKEIGR